MKSFKHTGNGPRYGNFAFSSKAGFGPSSGKVKNVSSYIRRAPKRVVKKAVGGLTEESIVEAPGFSDYAKGGQVKGVSDPMPVKEALAHKKGGKIRKYAQGGLASVTKDELRKKLGAQFTEKEFEMVQRKSKAQTNRMRPVKSGPRNTIGFNRTPKIGN